MKFLILVSVLISVSAASSLRGERVSNLLDGVLKDYDVRVRPNAGVTPTTVKLSGYAIQVGGYCGKNDDMKVDMYFRQFWNDPRLVLELKSDEKKEEKIKLGHTFKKDAIWTPDTFFSTSRKGEVVHFPLGQHLIRVEPNGDVLLSERVQVQAKCGDGSRKWNVGETRTCSLDVESYAFDNTDIDFKWKEGDLGSFKVGTTLYPYNVTSVSTAISVESLSQGNYTRVSINFEIVKLAEKIATMDEKRD